MKIILAQPRGFCAGVERAVDIVEVALKKFGPPIYVRHEIVHNRRVVDTLRAKGVRFVEEVDEIPSGAVTVFSAHGISRKVEENSSLRGLQTLDATCPLVTKVHKEGQRYVAKGYEVVLIGHEKHPEVEGTLGQIDGAVHLVGDVDDANSVKVRNPDRVAYITQTTLSVDDTREIIDALRRRFPNIIGPDTRDICYATQNRQTAVRRLADQVDLIIVVGASNSSNSNRLCEVGNNAGVTSHLVDDPSLVDPGWFNGIDSVGITAGASTPDELVQDVIDKLCEIADAEISTMAGKSENVRFNLPPALRDSSTLQAAAR